MEAETSAPAEIVLPRPRSASISARRSANGMSSPRSSMIGNPTPQPPLELPDYIRKRKLAAVKW